MKVAESAYIIRFPDCDPFHHLNNSRYIDYFINAREDHENKFYNFDTYKYLETTGKSWVVSQNQIAYLSPALLMEKVIIQTTILEWNPSDILIEMRMWDATKTKMKSVLWTRFVHYDLKNSKRVEHDLELTRMFQESINSIDKEITFEQRVSGIRKKTCDEIESYR